MTTTNEITKKPTDLKGWLNIPGFPEYLANKDGLIFSKRAARPLVPVFSGGYHYVTLVDNGVKHRHAVHRLIATVFYGSPECRMDVNHINGVKIDNTASNLEWVTRSENQIHAADNGLKPTGESSHLAKLTSEEVAQIRSLKGTRSQAAIGKMFGVSQTYVGKLHRNLKRRHD